MRGFEIAKGYEDVNLPKRSTKGSAGYDFELLRPLTLKPGEIKLGITGVKAYMNEDEVLKLYPRSSLPKKYGVTIPNNVGIIDSDYYGNIDNDGAIFIQLYNFTEETVTIEKGTRVAQGIFHKYLRANDDVATTVRNGGFGSTG
ncbi:MAG: dUTP diphosphatase [Bacillota bacterium]